jgi:hypothetical protein
MSDTCQWLHEQLESTPLNNYPLDLDLLPLNAIYFFYENGEDSTHKGIKQRIVRIGTHKHNNFRSRISKHYLLIEPYIEMALTKAKPADRSIFRKHIGRVLLNKANDPYLKIWNKKFTSAKIIAIYGHLRDIQKEQVLEEQITEILRGNFSFRFVVIEDDKKRIGSEGLENRLIGTVSNCKVCQASQNWLGSFSPEPKIRESGLWQVQHLYGKEIDDSDRDVILESLQEQSTL